MGNEQSLFETLFLPQLDAAYTLARWIVRINFSLIAEPAGPEDGGDEGLLRNLLVTSLKPRG